MYAFGLRPCCVCGCVCVDTSHGIKLPLEPSYWHDSAGGCCGKELVVFWSKYFLLVSAACSSCFRACVRACVLRRRSLSLEVVPQLKQRLRERGLPVSGKKSDLIARLLESMAGDSLALVPAPPPAAPRHSDAPSRSGVASPAGTAASAAKVGLVGGIEQHDADTVAGGRNGGLSEGWAAAAAEALIAGDSSSVRLGTPSGSGGGGKMNGTQARGAAAAAATPGLPGGVEGEEEARNRRMNGYTAMVSIVSGALDNAGEARNGGVTSSRALGRELSRLPSPENPSQSALTCLKSRWPSLMAFLKGCPSDFTVTDVGKPKEFGVLKNDRGAWEAGAGAGGRGDDKPPLEGWNRTAVPRAAAAAGDGRQDSSHRGG